VWAIRHLPERLRTGRLREPKVSVEMIVYNQAEFIAQTLDSVLNQKTTFEWEIVVGDDLSTDGTREILRSYAAECPERIRLLLHQRRLGPHKPGLEGKHNFLTTLRACRGEYIALLEGDDYWTDDHKLEKQVQFLDTRPDCSLCCHAVAVEYSGARSQHWGAAIGGSSESIYSLEEFLRFDTKPQIAAPSMVFRRRALRNLPTWFDEVFNGDYALQVLLAEQGNVGYLPDCMAVHRKHDDGMSRLYDTDPEFCDAMFLELLVTLNKHFNDRFRPILEPYIENGERVAAAAAVRSLASAHRPETPIRLSLDDFVAQAGQLVPGAHGRSAIVTKSTAWAYGATLRLPTDALREGEDHAAYACIQARAEGAAAGIGVLHRNGDRFLDRYRLEPSEVESEIRLGIPSLKEAGNLVVQTWGRADSATVHIESIDLVVVPRVGDPGLEPGTSSLSEKRSNRLS
jgi:glycosyltransferase involved in cell wall biosynthesis